MKRIFLLATLCLASGLIAPRSLFAESGLIFDQTQGTLTGRLNVTSNIAAAGSVTASSATLANTEGAGLRVSSSAYLAVSGGNVGIGTDNPSYKLDIGGFVPTDQTLRLASASGYNTAIRLMEAGDENGASLKYDGTNNRFGIFGHNASTTGVEYLTILRDAGYVGIGTTVPSHKLEVAGAVNLTGASSAYRLSSWDVASWDGGSGLRLGGPTGTWTYTSLYTNGTEKVRLDTNGNVGIGTAGPTGKLSIFSSNGSDVDFLHANSGTFPKVTAIGLGGDAVSYDYTSAGATLNVKGSAQIAALQSAASDAPTDMAFYTTAGGNVGERMRITTGGNVGIGTTNPSTKIDVRNLAAAGTYAYFGASSDGGARGLQFTSSDNGVYLGAIHKIDATSAYGVIDLATGGTARLRIDSTGSVGIGTTAPGSILEVKAVTPVISINGTTGANFRGLSFQQAGTETAIIKTETNGGELRLQTGMSDAWGGFQTFYTNNLERARITSSGNVGIGTTTPNAKLQVTDSFSNLRFGYNLSAGSGGPSLMLETASNVYGDIVWNTVSADQVRLRGSSYGLAIGGTNPRLNIGYPDANYTSAALVVNGNVGIGMTNPNLATLQVAGSIMTTTGLNITGMGGFFNAANKFGIDQNGGTSRFYASGADATTAGTYEFHVIASDGTPDTIAMVINNFGNVGIGTAAPANKLYVAGGTSSASSLATSKSVAAFYLQPKNTSGYGLAFGSGPNDLPYIQNVTIGGDASGDMTLQPYGGNVGIGTTAPGEKLTVSGNVQVLGDRVRLAGGAVGTSATSLGININGANGGGVALLLCSRNTSAGGNTGASVYMLRYGYDGNNYSTQLVGGTDWVTFSIDGSGNLFASQSGGNASCSIITNK
ncbi:MAG: hypothetical protein NTY45_10025 [Elusimicrobia bacterium]|nr:hypothetical protein [Elusimicrobiota bacterium]